MVASIVGFLVEYIHQVKRATGGRRSAADQNGYSGGLDNVETVLLQRLEPKGAPCPGS
jgi:hypothetical protein